MASRKRRALNQLTKDSEEDEKLNGEYGDAVNTANAARLVLPVSQRRIVRAARRLGTHAKSSGITSGPIKGMYI